MNENESDESYRDRICDALPPNSVFWAEDLSDAYGEELDAIGSHFGVSRREG